MELYIFARFHAREGQERAVEETLRTALGPTSQEAGCLEIHLHRSIRDSRLFYVYSRWVDEAAFENHIRLPHTLKMVSTMEPLIDHPLDVTRAERLV